VFWFLGCAVCLLKTLLTQLNDDSHLQFFQVKTGWIAYQVFHQDVQATIHQ
jgi:hypothetical protein